jgi:hypothetical protein
MPVCIVARSEVSSIYLYKENVNAEAFIIPKEMLCFTVRITEVHNIIFHS